MKTFPNRRIKDFNRIQSLETKVSTIRTLDLDCIIFDLEGNPKAILEYRRYSFKGTSRPKDWFREWNGGSYTIARQIFKVAELLKVPLFVVLREEIPGTLIGICKPVREGGYKDLVFVSEEEYQDWLRWLVEQ